MKFHPYNGTVLCILEKQKKREQKIIFEQEELPIYKIVESGINDKQYDFLVGDRIITNSIPTKLKIDDNNEFYLVKQEYIAGKII